MKYQQLENLESGWKWKYLVKKHREGELITRYVEASAAKEAVDLSTSDASFNGLRCPLVTSSASVKE